MSDEGGSAQSLVLSRPFSPATQAGQICVCVACGRQACATHEISKYPFRYTPGRGWSIEGRTQALRCDGCTEHAHNILDFYEANDVWVYEAKDDYGRGNMYRVKFFPRAQRVNEPTPNTKTQTDQDTDMNNDKDNLQDAYEDGGSVMLGVAPVTRSKRLKAQARDMGGALGTGLQLAAANEAGEVLVDIAKELTSELPSVQLALEHPDGREVAKLLVAIMLHTGARQTGAIPQAELIGKVCEMQMTASSFTLLGPRLNQMRKHLTKLAKIGEAVEGAGAYSEEEMDVANAEVASELRSLKMRIAELEADDHEVEVEIEETGTAARGAQ